MLEYHGQGSRKWKQWEPAVPDQSYLLGLHLTSLIKYLLILTDKSIIKNTYRTNSPADCTKCPVDRIKHREQFHKLSNMLGILSNMADGCKILQTIQF